MHELRIFQVDSSKIEENVLGTFNLARAISAYDGINNKEKGLSFMVYTLQRGKEKGLEDEAVVIPYPLQ